MSGENRGSGQKWLGNMFVLIEHNSTIKNVYIMRLHLMVLNDKLLNYKWVFFDGQGNLNMKKRRL